MYCLHCRRPKHVYVRAGRCTAGDALTIREEQIISRVSTGKTNKEIGAELCIVEGTVKVYLSQIFTKAGVTNRTELAVWWLKRDNPSQSA
jgi:DNA-binding NarL/FixJ family response regulator